MDCQILVNKCRSVWTLWISPQMNMSPLGPELFSKGDCASIHKFSVPTCGHGDARRKHAHTIRPSAASRAVRVADTLET